MKIAVMVHRGQPELLALGEEFPDCRFARIDSAAQLEAVIDELEVLVASASRYDAGIARLLLQRGTRLRWVQSAAAGYEAFVQHGIPEGVLFANASGIWAVPVAEHALALLLGLLRRLPILERNRARREWARETVADAVASLDGATVVVVGLGSIGREVARRAQLFQARVIGVNRSGRPVEPVAEVVPLARLNEVAALADAVVLCLAATPATRHALGAEAIARMRPHAVVVNVARGDVLDQAALVKALAEGRLGGAGLDVFTPEPLPADDPLWDFDNVVLSPHVAGYGARSFQRLARLVGDNLRRFQAGEPLINQLEIGADDRSALAAPPTKPLAPPRG